MKSTFMQLHLCGLVIAFVSVHSVSSFAQTNTASITNYNLSVLVGLLSRPDQTHATVSTYFTTYDGRTDVYPLNYATNGLLYFSEELRPRSGSPGTYEADYVEGISTGFLDYGSVAIIPASVNTDASGVPDLVNVSRAFNSDISGTVQEDSPSVSTRTLRGHMYRAAGSTLGTIWYSTGAGAYTNTGTFQAVNSAGTVTYSRGTVNRLAMNLAKTDMNGNTVTGTGSTTFSVLSPDQIVVTGFAITNSAGFVVRSHDFTLKRSVNRYSGVWQSDDGNPLTPWPDYTSVAVEIVDPNDADRNGIPDLSDSFTVPLKITEIGIAPGGKVHLEVQGPVGTDVTFFTSSDLANWVPWVVLPNPQGSLQVSDLVIKSSKDRFYSVR
jgi:hypothetical protein